MLEQNYAHAHEQHEDGLPSGEDSVNGVHSLGLGMFHSPEVQVEVLKGVRPPKGLTRLCLHHHYAQYRITIIHLLILKRKKLLGISYPSCYIPTIVQQMVYILSWGRTMLIQMSSMNMAFSMGRICQQSTGILLGLEGSIHLQWKRIQHISMNNGERQNCNICIQVFKHKGKLQLMTHMLLVTKQMKRSFLGAKCRLQL